MFAWLEIIPEVIQITIWVTAVLVTIAGLIVTGVIFPKTGKKLRRKVYRYAGRTAKRYTKKVSRKALRGLKKRVKKLRKARADKKEWRPEGMEQEGNGKPASHICGAPTKDGSPCQRRTRKANCGRH